MWWSIACAAWHWACCFYFSCFVFYLALAVQLYYADLDKIFVLNKKTNKLVKNLKKLKEFYL